jgi:hypothetical protein
MARRSTPPNHARLTVTALEDRAVPAGMLEALYQPGSLELLGDGSANHVRVEMPTRHQIVVSSQTGPIQFLDPITGEPTLTDQLVLPAPYGLYIFTGNGSDDIEVIGPPGSDIVFFDLLIVEISSENGDDHILIDDLRAPLFVSTGHGSDLVTMRECYGYEQDPDSLYSLADINTGSGDDRFVMLGTNRFDILFVQLGAGDDVLEGDATAGAGYLRTELSSLTIDGGGGYDRLLNVAYFNVAFPGELSQIEAID